MSTATTPDTDAKLEAEEMFIYLGRIDSMHFFLHTHYVHRPTDLIARMCADVYNCLIHETMIQRGDNIVVFNQSAAGGTAKIQPVRVTHVHFAAVTFTDDWLNTTYVRLLEIDRSKDKTSMIIKAELSAGTPARYTLCELPNSLASRGSIAPIGLIAPKGIRLEKIIDARTIKPIPYLKEDETTDSDEEEK
jgi:hypothetical protein